MKEFIRYQTFQNKTDFEELTSILTQNEIPFEVEDYPINFISDSKNTNFSHEYVVKLEQEKFKIVDEILMEIATDQLQNLPADYYLLDFTTEELKALVSEQESWSKFDLIVALDLLQKRGESISKDTLETIKNKRLETLSTPEKKQSVYIAIGYISSFLGGILGIIIGYHLTNHKRILPTGERVFEYSESDRKHGKIILTVGVIVLSVGLVIRLMYIN